MPDFENQLDINWAIKSHSSVVHAVNVETNVI